MKKILLIFIIVPHLLFSQNDWIGYNQVNGAFGRSFTSIKNHKTIERSPSRIFTPYEDAAATLSKIQVSIEYMDEHSYIYTDPFLSLAITYLYALPYAIATDNEIAQDRKEVYTNHLDLLRFGFGGWTNSGIGIYVGGQFGYYNMGSSEKFMENYREEQAESNPNTRFSSADINGFSAGLGAHAFYQLNKFLFQYSFMYGRRMTNNSKREEDGKSQLSGRDIQNIITVKYGKPEYGIMSTFRFANMKLNFIEKPDPNRSFPIYEFDNVSGNNIEFLVGAYFSI